MMTGMQPIAYSYIRFSSVRQSKGDSLRRQTKLSEDYALQHGLTLDTTLHMHDLGVSAYDGSNITKGALGEFLKVVEAGRVARGSFLLVESLDRLSRAAVLDALQIFTQILNAGITIVTLMDGMEYSRESAEKNWAQLIISISIMARAVEESATKSNRVLTAWQRKRDGAVAKKTTAKGPAWLKLNREENRFEVIEERAKIIRYIYKLSASGLGNYTIVKRLNAEGIPFYGNENGIWRATSVQWLLISRAVMGEHQPCKMVNDRATPDGDPIPDYFPAIISEEQFYKVRAIRSARDKGADKTIRKKGVAYPNLFTGFCKCGYCGGGMIFVGSGRTVNHEKGKYRYLTCHNAKHALGCTKARIPYHQFEHDFLEDLAELDLSQIFNDGEDTELARLQSEHGVMLGQLADTKVKLQRLLDAMMESDSPPRTVIAKISELEAQQDTLEGTLKGLASQIGFRSTQKSTVEAKKAELHDLSSKMQGVSDSELYELRSRLVQAIRSIVKTIYFYPDGDPILGVTGRFYTIRFHGGGTRTIWMREEGKERGFKLVLEKVSMPSLVDKFK